MASDARVHIRLDICSRAPIGGVLFSDDAPAREFQGWLQLITALAESSRLEIAESDAPTAD